MATKPLTIPQVWATNALYTTGPFIGQPSKVVPAAAVAAEGHRPGALFPTPAEYENEQQNRVTDWIVSWLYLGSSAGAADAHIVETDSTGRATLHGLDVNDLVDETAVNIDGGNTIAPTVVATCTTGAVVIQSDIGNSTGTAFSASVGTGAGTGLDATLSATAAGGAGVRISTVGACQADGVVITHTGTGGRCIDVVGNSVSQAIRATASGNQNAILTTGSGTGAGLSALSGATAGANAILATTQNNTGFGVSASIPVTATGAAAALRGIGLGSGAGVLSSATDGAGVSTSASGAGGVALFISGKANNPTTITNGAVDFNTTVGTLVTASSAGGNYRDVATAVGNHCTGGTTDNVAQTLGGVVWVTAATFTLSGGDAPARVGRTLRLRFRCDARMTAVATGTLNVRISRTAPGPTTTLVTRSGAGIADGAGYFLAVATTSWQRSIILDVDYTIASAATHTFIVEIQASGGTDIRVRDCSLLPEGLF